MTERISTPCEVCGDPCYAENVHRVSRASANGEKKLFYVHTEVCKDDLLDKIRHDSIMSRDIGAVLKKAEAFLGSALEAMIAQREVWWATEEIAEAIKSVKLVTGKSKDGSGE